MSRPKQVESVGSGEESVWDYPRPPRVEESAQHIQVVFNGVIIAQTHRAVRVLETSHPPVYYIPPEDIAPGVLVPSPNGTYCEWKGGAGYYAVRVGDHEAKDAAWYYPEPKPAFETIKGYVAFYPGKMDFCLVDGARVQPQPGGFYGGWITPEIKGPFKGEPGTGGW